MMQLNTLSAALFNQIVQVGLTHVAYAANFLHCYNSPFDPQMHGNNTPGLQPQTPNYRG